MKEKRGKMAKGPTYRVPFRRRREGKTHYHKRLRLIISGKPRLVVRKSNKYIRVQLISAEKYGDRTIASAISSELPEFGWRYGMKNLPAAYLTGFLLGSRAAMKGYEDAILDIGLHTPSPGSRVYAALNGAVDAGMNIPHDESIFPDERRIRGEHIAEHMQIDDIVENFEEVKRRIEEEGSRM